MAYVVSIATANGVDSGETTPIPSSLEDDLILFVYHRRFGTHPTVSSTGGGWSSVTQFGAAYYAHKIQGATPDTEMTVGSGSNTSTLMIIVIRGADTTTPIDGFYQASAQNSNTYTGPAGQTATNTNSLVLHVIATDSVGTNQELVCAPGYEVVGYARNGSNDQITVCGTQWPDTSTIPTLTWTHHDYSSKSRTPAMWVINDSGESKYDAYVDVESPPATYVHLMGGGLESGNLGAATNLSDPTGYTSAVSSFNGETLTNSSASTNITNTFHDEHTTGAFYLSSGTRQPYVWGVNLASAADYSGEILCTSINHETSIIGDYGNSLGTALGMSNGSYTRLWHLGGKGTRPALKRGIYPHLLELDSASFDHTDYGTYDVTSLDRIVFAHNHLAHYSNVELSPVVTLNTMSILGGNATRPASFATGERVANSNGLLTVQGQYQQSNTQFFCCQKIQVGNGTDAVTWVSEGQSAEWPSAYDNDGGTVQFKIGPATLGFYVYASASDSINLSGTTFNMGDFHNWEINSSTHADATYDLSNVVIFGGTVTLNDIGEAISSMTFSGCKEIAKNDCDLSGGCVIDASADTYAVSVATEAEFNDLRNCTFTDNNYSIQITGNHGGDTWTGTGMTVSGGTGSYDIEYTGTGTLTLSMDTGSGWSTARATETGGGTLTVSAPTTDVTVTSDVASSDIKIFDGTSQTVTASTTGTTLSHTYSGTETWFYTVQKAGYIPQRGSITGTNEDLTVNVTLQVDPVYDSGHGLTEGTEYAYNETTRVLTIVAAQQGRDIYSSLIDEFISDTSFYNVPFPMQAIGPDRIDFTSDGTTAATIDSGDIQYWRGAGMEWEHATTGAKTHKFCAVKGVGTNASGTKGYYQYAAGSGTTALSLVSNNIDQVIQFYSDPNGDDSTADGYDRSTHLVLKLFNEGYYQCRADILTAFGISALEAFEYTVSMQGVAFDFASGDQGITIATLTDDSAAPQDHGGSGNAFSYELVDPGANTAAALAAQLNYDIFTDPTATLYTSYTAFNLPDIIIGSGGTYETEEGWVEDEDDTLGFYVSRSAADHPNFTRFEDDDGTYYTPAVTSSVAVSGLQNNGSASRTLLQIFNTTASTSSAWQASTAYSVGDRVLRSTGLGTENTGGLWFLCTTAGTSNDTEPTWDTTPGNTTADTAGSGAGDVVWTAYKALVYDADPASASYADTYTDGEEYVDGDSVRIRHTELVGSTSFHLVETTAVVGSTGWSAVLAPAAESTYAGNAVDGSSITTFSLDVANMEFDVVADTDFTAEQAFAWYCYELTGTNGMHNFWGAVTAIDASNYRINTSVANTYFDETVGAFIKQIASGGGLARIFRDDGARPAKDPTTGGYGIEINWQNPVYLAETGSVTAEGVAAEVITQINSTAQSEPSGAPAANESLGTKLAYLFMMARNKVTVTASSKAFHDDDGNSEFTKALSDDGTTYTEDETV